MRNKINQNPKLTREQLIDIQKQHITQAKLLINHMAEVKKKIQELEEEKKELLVKTEKKIKKLEEVAKKNQIIGRLCLLLALIKEQ